VALISVTYKLIKAYTYLVTVLIMRKKDNKINKGGESEKKREEKNKNKDEQKQKKKKKSYLKKRRRIKRPKIKKGFNRDTARS
jgi:hypothetical protein